MALGLTIKEGESIFVTDSVGNQLEIKFNEIRGTRVCIFCIGPKLFKIHRSNYKPKTGGPVNEEVTEGRVEEQEKPNTEGTAVEGTGS